MHGESGKMRAAIHTIHSSSRVRTFSSTVSETEIRRPGWHVPCASDQSLSSPALARSYQKVKWDLSTPFSVLQNIVSRSKPTEVHSDTMRPNYALSQYHIHIENGPPPRRDGGPRSPVAPLPRPSLHAGPAVRTTHAAQAVPTVTPLATAPHAALNHDHSSQQCFGTQSRLPPHPALDFLADHYTAGGVPLGSQGPPSTVGREPSQLRREPGAAGLHPRDRWPRYV